MGTTPKKSNRYRIRLSQEFDLAHTLSCGQCFRWRRQGDCFDGIVGETAYRLSQSGKTLTVTASSPDGGRDALFGYFDLSRDLDDVYATFPRDALLVRSVRRFRGMRMMRQDPWETVISFILSINKRIDHISQIIETMSQRYGRPVALDLDGERIVRHTFPASITLATLSEAELRRCGMGFRAPFVRAVSRAVEDGRLDLDALGRMSTEDAVEKLQEFHGIGPKVASIIMLFGYGRYDTFPVDVWIHRIMTREYYQGKKVSPRDMMAFARGHFGPYRGYAQQYLYHYVRNFEGKNAP